MHTVVAFIALVVLCCFQALVQADNYLPQHGFKQPFTPRMVIVDSSHFTENQPPLQFWQLHGDAAMTDLGVRLTPALESRRGAVWNTEVLHLTFSHISQLSAFGFEELGNECRIPHTRCSQQRC